MSHCRTLRQLCDRETDPVTLRLACYHVGPASVEVTLFLGRGPRGPFALAFADHVDPEGSSVELLDVSHVLDRVGERQLEEALAGVTFESGVTTAVCNWEDFARLVPEILEP